MNRILPRAALPALGVALLAASGPSRASAAESPQCQQSLTDAAASIQAKPAGPERIARIKLVLGAPEFLVPCFDLDDPLARKIAKIIEVRRIDKQVGAASGASAGSTTLVSSGAAPRLLGLAVEHGAIAQAIAGSTTTFRTTPAKLITALSKAYGPDAPLPDDKSLRALGRVSVSASFDTTRTATADSPKGSPFQANYRQLSEAALRIQLWNDRDPFSRRNLGLLRTFSQGAVAKKFANDAKAFLLTLTRLAGYDAILEDTGNKLAPVTTAAAAETELRAYVAAVKKLHAAEPGADAQIRTLVDSWAKVDADHKELFRQIAKAPMLTFEYAFERPPIIKATAAAPAPAPAPALAPDHHTSRLIYAASLLEAQYTLIASATWFHDARPDMRGNFRSFQLGGKIDVPLGEIPPLARGTLTFSGLFAHLHQKPLGFDLKINDEKVNKPGSIGFFQAKYTIPLSDNGVSIPISITMSNRTELIKEREIRGNIGLSFDLDKLMARK